ncbi:NAD(P)-dependent alcohol dehydrogenase [Actinoplanes couchii]|uniref:Zinc-binding alcohol dehydrogenase n=1 Tax=Actinoplanes couchii TaxID=403638 RepID=A0ABQ3XFZ2_9ACTN|nr:zinc-binding alcohol dehydrogenase [Actinoplanes couchii]
MTVMRTRAALVETTGGPFVVRDVELDEPRADEVLVRITAAGICHTDLIMRGRWPAAALPMVFGHEGTGVVEAVGSAVLSVSAGDTVALSYRSCRECTECRAGHPAYCLLSDLNMRGRPAFRLPDGSPVHGGFFGQSSFAGHVTAHQSCVVPIPAGLDPVLAAPLGCSVQTGAGTVVDVLRPAPGDVVAVFGTGSVGLSAVMAAVALGCTVIPVDPNPARRDLALELGAADIAPDRFSHAIDTTGRPEVITRAIGGLQRRGTLALVGIGGKAEIDVMTVMTNGIRIRGVIEGDADPGTFLPRLIDMNLPVQKLVTAYPFEEIETAARDAAAGKVVKPVLTFR